MSIINELVYNRTQADVDRVLYPKEQNPHGRACRPSPLRKKLNIWPE